jgi:hypothetical protein
MVDSLSLGTGLVALLVGIAGLVLAIIGFSKINSDEAGGIKGPPGPPGPPGPSGSQGSSGSAGADGASQLSSTELNKIKSLLSTFDVTGDTLTVNKDVSLTKAMKIPKGQSFCVSYGPQNSDYKFCLQADGNVVQYNGGAVWATNKYG